LWEFRKYLNELVNEQTIVVERFGILSHIKLLRLSFIFINITKNKKINKS